MKLIISILLLLPIFGISKEAPDICNRDIISLEQVKQCKDEADYLNDYTTYLNMPIKDLIKSSKKNNMFKEAIEYKLVHNYQDFKEFMQNKKELNRYKKYLNCNSKGDVFHIVYKENRAILTCGNGNGFTFNILIIQNSKAKLIPLFAECGMFMPEPIEPPQNNKKGSKNEKIK